MIRYIGFKALWAVVQAVSLYALIATVSFTFVIGWNGIVAVAFFIAWLLNVVMLINMQQENGA